METDFHWIPLVCYATAMAYGVWKRQSLTGTVKRQRKIGNGMDFLTSKPNQFVFFARHWQKFGENPSMHTIDITKTKPWMKGCSTHTRMHRQHKNNASGTT